MRPDVPTTATRPRPALTLASGSCCWSAVSSPSRVDVCGTTPRPEEVPSDKPIETKCLVIVVHYSGGHQGMLHSIQYG